MGWNDGASDFVGRGRRNKKNKNKNKNKTSSDMGSVPDQKYYTVLT